MRLSIVIPAYNEEGAIASIVERCLAARETIRKRTSLKDVEVLVVSDGSSDRTAQIAREFEKKGGVRLIAYEKNRGYGAAIKTGFEAASGEFVAFLDADGTCDPEYFTELFNNLEKNGADVSIGSRMGPGSKMPAVRRLGNRVYAFLVSWLGGSTVSDSASGMRILKRSSLARLYPLPDGMNFTPAMSAKAVLDPELKIVETFMPYAERIGRSKLSVLKDGWRFLTTILEVALFYRPLPFFLTGACVLLGLAFLYGVPLVSFYAENGFIRETDIYRVSAVVVAGALGMNLLLLGFTADAALSLFSGRPMRFIKPGPAALSGFLLCLSGVVLNRHTLAEYLTTGQIHVHWVYLLAGALLILAGAELMAAAFLHRLLRMYRDAFVFRRELRRHE